MAIEITPSPKIHFVHPLLHARDWQHRPELDQLCNWWKQMEAGVCALVGIGGAGKTAIAERFLRILPGAMPKTPQIPKKDDLPTPSSLFVFSFYDVPNPDSFFLELAAWLTGKPADKSKKVPSYQQTLMWLNCTGGCLLVLDGLEEVQHDRARGVVFGKILDGRLSDFVLRIAQGYVPGVSTIITTRFPIAELDEKQPPCYEWISVEEIEEETAIALLRQREVKGSNVELAHIAKECGYHALTVDMVGGYIADLGGDAKLELGTAEELKKVAESEPNPRRRRVLKQEYKFARIAERYRERLKQKDSTALALLERVCLFRLGIDTKTLTSIFTGKRKTKISGPELAKLKEKGIQDKLDWLVEMRLLEAIQTDEGDKKKLRKYLVHPAVREGFLKGLDRDIAQRGHEAVRQGLESSLGGKKVENPSDPATLDLLEEIVYHTLEAGHMQEAWYIYWNRIGNYQNLLWRLGAYKRGERICQTFVGGRSPVDTPLPKGLTDNDQMIFINEWALYLEHLVQLDVVAHCYKRGNELDYQKGNWKGASIGNQNLANVLLLAGRLKEGLQAAKEALRMAKRANDAQEWRDSYIYRGRVRAWQGETKGALNDFRVALRWQIEATGKTEEPLYSLSDIQHTQLLGRLGQYKEAARLTEANKDILNQYYGAQHQDIPKCNLILASLAHEQGNNTSARNLLVQAHEWAIARDDKQVLCWSTLVRARITLDEALLKQENKPQLFQRSHDSMEEGLRIARDCGYGIYHIDLLLLRAQVDLYEGNADNATEDVDLALNKGVHPKKESGLPTLLAANDPECGYAWGIAEGQHLLAEAWLLQAAQIMGKAEFTPARFDSLPQNVKKLIKDAREELVECAKLRKKIKDPKVADTNRVLDQLNGGILTYYPLKPLVQPEDTPHKSKSKKEKTVAEFDVFLCHNSNDKPTVRELGEALKKRGLKVWLDEWELIPGRPWQEALEKTIETIKAAAVCVGKDGLGPWQNREMRGCLSEFVDRSLPVIPVLLPTATTMPTLPLFLKQFTWVDLRGGLTDEGLSLIEWGIRGKKPNP